MLSYYMSDVSISQQEKYRQVTDLKFFTVLYICIMQL